MFIIFVTIIGFIFFELKWKWLGKGGKGEPDQRHSPIYPQERHLSLSNLIKELNRKRIKYYTKNDRGRAGFRPLDDSVVHDELIYKIAYVLCRINPKKELRNEFKISLRCWYLKNKSLICSLPVNST